MNEKIRELAEQAEEMCLRAEPWRILSVCQSVDKVWREKFAELIVKECASICEHRYTYMNKDMSEGAFEAMACHDSILEHFGIEY